MNEGHFSIKGLIIATVLGGITMFFWFMISWMALPWHTATLHTFQDTEAVLHVLTQNIDQPGVYTVPHPNSPPKDGVQPRVYSVITPQSQQNFPLQLGVELLTCLGGAGILALLVGMISATGTQFPYGCKVPYIALIGVLVAIASYVPSMNWWNFPLDYTFN